MERFLRSFLACLALPLLAWSQSPAEPELLPGDEALGLAAGVQRTAAIAAGGGGYLVAWLDRRAEFSPLVGSQGTEDVYALRLDADGAPLDAAAFPVASQALFGEMERVRVAWNGAHWLVTWDQRSPTEFFYSSEIVGVRVAPDGSVVDATPISILKFQSSSTTQYALESDGSGWLVVVQGSSFGESDVRGVRIAADGTVLDPGGKTIFSPPSLHLHFDLAFAQDEYLLVWTEFPGIRARRIAPDLTPIGGTITITPSSDANDSAVASNGTSFLVAWDESLPSGSLVRAALVSHAGVVGVPVDVTPGGGGIDQRDPDVAWNGAEWVLVFESGLFSSTLSVARVSAAGAVLDFGGVATNQGNLPRDPVVAAGAGEAQLAWDDTASDQPPDPGDVFGTHVGPGLAIQQEVALSVGAPRQGFPDLAAGGPGYLAVFRSERGGTIEILMQRLDSFGRPLDPEPAVVASGAAVHDPEVAWNGSVFLVVWEELGVGGFPDDLLRARRVLPSGAFLDPSPIDVMAGIDPDVAAADDLFLVVGTRFLTPEIQRAFAARVVGSSGAVLDPAGIEIGANFAQFPEVASMGDRWVATWQRNFSHDDPKSTVHAAVILPDGSHTASVTVGGSGTAGGAKDPTVAAHGTAGLVVWVDGTTPSAVDLRGRLVAPDGSVAGGSFAVSTASGAQTAPDAAWNGSEFTVVWEDLRNEASFFDERPDVFAARLSAAGAVLDPSGFAVATDATHERQPTVAGAFGDALLAFASLEPDPPLGAYRVAVSYDDEWQVLDGGTAGVTGVPALHGEGVLASGGSLRLTVTSAAPGAPGGVVLGLAAIDLPLFGGTLVPSPDVFLPFATNGEGSALVAVPVPPGVPPGTQVWAQAGILDSAAPGLVALTDALTQAAP